MNVTYNYSFWEFWAPYAPTEFYGNQKCTFDGINKLIIINPGETEVSVKEDIYSGWKEWFSVRDNAKFLPAIRTTGGDPIGGGQFTGDTYFTINDWKIVLTGTCSVDGVIYSDDYPSPFVTESGVSLVTNRVSSLVQTVSTGGSSTAPTAQENAQAVWDQSIANALPGTAGDKLKQGLTTGNFLGLK